MRVVIRKRTIPSWFLPFLVLVFEVQITAQTVPATVITLSPNDRAALAMDLLNRTLADPNEYYVECLLKIVDSNDRPAVARLLTALKEEGGHTTTVSAVGIVSAAASEHTVSDSRQDRLQVTASLDIDGVDRWYSPIELNATEYTAEFTNLTKILDTVLVKLSERNSDRESRAQRGRAARLTQSVTSHESPNLFLPKVIRDGHTVIDKAWSQAALGAQVLSRPRGLLAMRFLDPLACVPDAPPGSWADHDVLVLPDFNWDRIICTGLQLTASSDWIRAQGSHGTALGSFAGPVDVDASGIYLYVADCYNKRVQRCQINADNGNLIAQLAITHAFGEPVGVASALIWTGGEWYAKVAVLDRQLAK